MNQANPVAKVILAGATQLVLMKYAADRETALKLMHQVIEDLLKECNPSSSPKS